MDEHNYDPKQSRDVQRFAGELADVLRKVRIEQTVQSQGEAEATPEVMAATSQVTAMAEPVDATPEVDPVVQIDITPPAMPWVSAAPIEPSSFDEASRIDLTKVVPSVFPQPDPWDIEPEPPPEPVKHIPRQVYVKPEAAVSDDDRETSGFNYDRPFEPTMDELGDPHLNAHRGYAEVNTQTTERITGVLEQYSVVMQQILLRLRQLESAWDRYR